MLSLGQVLIYIGLDFLTIPKIIGKMVHADRTRQSLTRLLGTCHHCALTVPITRSPSINVPNTLRFFLR